MLYHIRIWKIFLFTSLLISLSYAEEDYEQHESLGEEEHKPVKGEWDDCMIQHTTEERMYCQLNCQSLEDGGPIAPVEANCGAWGTPERPDVVWAKLSKLRNLSTLEFRPRLERALTIFPSPLVFTEMKKLTYFIMKLSKIEKLHPFTFGNSTTLSNIWIEDNEIKELDFLSISHLSNASKINLGRNQLKEVNRHVFVDLPVLQGLYLDRNGIQIIHDKAFVELKSLEELDLQKNNLSTLVKEVFSGLGNLKQLELQENQIEYLGPQVFSEMPLLRDLDLHNNQIRSIHPTALFNLKHLARLNLKRNKIVSIEPPTFSQTGDIYFLDLRHNELEALTEEAVHPIYTNFQQSTMELMLEGNRMTCGCHILWMRKLFYETENENVRMQLGKVQCNMFQSSGEREHRHVHADIMLEAESHDEASTFAFDGTKNVTQLEPNAFKCGSKGVEIPQSDEEGSKPKRPTSKPDLRQSLHQSHIDTTGRAPLILSSSLFTTGLSFLLLFKANILVL